MTIHRQGKPLTARRVLVWFLGFFFVVFGANLTMSWFAVTTFSGVETRDAYARGRDFNVQIAAAEEQRALGWNAAVEVENLSSNEVLLVLTMKDRDGDPLEAMAIEGFLVRRVHDGVDQKVVFAALGNGKYTGVSPLPVQGKWQLQALARDAAGRQFRIVHDFMMHP